MDNQPTPSPDLRLPPADSNDAPVSLPPVAVPAAPGQQAGQTAAPGQPGQSQLVPAGQAGNPPTAQDSDHLDPAWIHKVDQLIHQSNNDPRQMMTQYNQLKARYIAERYHKTIKTVKPE